jgi:hypothetical protein
MAMVSVVRREWATKPHATFKAIIVKGCQGSA